LPAKSCGYPAADPAIGFIISAGTRSRALARQEFAGAFVVTLAMVAVLPFSAG
jgi:hypothetical protein